MDTEMEMDTMQEEINVILESMGVYDVNFRNGYAHNHYEAKSTDCPADYWDEPHDPWFD